MAKNKNDLLSAKRLQGVMGGLGLCVLSGCALQAQAPDFLLLDSYFPNWLIGVLVAAPIAVLIRFLLIKVGVDDYLPFRFFVYIGIWLIISMTFTYVFSPR